jgi:tRNA (guanine26-N2/guanine27-N2)-dimethyltransferase
MYGGPLHNVGFIQRVLAQLNKTDKDTYSTTDRIKGMLHTALEEITFGAGGKHSTKSEVPQQLDPLIPKVDAATLDEHPFFFIPSAVAKIVHCSAPSSAAMRGALRHAGFKATMSHCKPGSIRTDAPWTAIWHIMLEWVRQKAPLKKQLRQGTAGYAIMSKATAHQVEQDEGEEEEGKTIEAESMESVATAVVENPKSEDPTISANSEQPENARPSYLGTDFEVVFDEKLGRDPDRGKYVRYQLAPRENWGPMARAK